MSDQIHDILPRPVNHIGPIKKKYNIIVTSPYFQKPKETFMMTNGMENLRDRIRKKNEIPQDREITRKICEEFRNQVQQAVDKIALNLGLSCAELGSITYSSYDINIGSVRAFGTFYNPDGTVKTKEQLQWEQNCENYGLSKSVYGKEFVFDQDEQYGNIKARFYDIRPIKRTYPIIVRFENGEQAAISVTTAKKYINQIH